MGTKSKSTKAQKALKTATPKTTASPAPKAAAAKKTGKPSAGSASGKSATKAHKATKSDLLEEAAELLTRIETAETACQCARLELDDAREGVKCAKQNYGACVDELRKLARARREKHPLFEAGAKGGKPLLDGNAGATVNAEPQPATDDSWKALSIHAAAFTDAQDDALEAADVRTLGELQAAMNRHGQWWAKELKIHGRHQQGIEDTFNEYLTKFSGSGAGAGSECVASNAKASAAGEIQDQQDQQAQQETPQGSATELQVVGGGDEDEAEEAAASPVVDTMEPQT
jgi:hypothetical protein